MDRCGLENIQDLDRTDPGKLMFVPCVVTCPIAVDSGALSGPTDNYSQTDSDSSDKSCCKACSYGQTAPGGSLGRIPKAHQGAGHSDSCRSDDARHKYWSLVEVEVEPVVLDRSHSQLTPLMVHRCNVEGMVFVEEEAPDRQEGA